MKKLFLLLTLAFINLAAFSQVTQYSAKQIVARDSLYINGKWIKNIKIDTSNINGLTRDAMSADAIYDFVDGRTLKFYLDLADTAAAIRAAPGPPDCTNKLLTDWNVSWQGTGFNYTVHGGLSDGTGSYRIICDIYTADSATVTFSAADAEDDRIDIIYLDATGVHVREGTLAAPGTAVRPTVDAEEILLTEVLVAAGATEPTLTQLIVYNENTESVVTNTGTTTNGANATFVYRGTLSTNVTNINNNDQVFFTKAPSLSTWNVLNFDALSLAIRLKANLPTNANIGVALQVGTATVGTEVIIPLVRTNT